MKTDTQEAEKICRYCAESIPAAAKICPRCRQWLTFCSFRNPLVSFVGILVPFLGIMAVFLYVIQNFMNPSPYYSDFKGSLQILQSNMNWVETSDGDHVFVTGVLTNQSQVAWKEPEFECRFFNSKGQMIDAATSLSYLTVVAGADSAFRVSVKPALESNAYSSFRISISNARNARSRF
jgi:hypothetical protein